MLLNESFWFRQKMEQYVQEGDILLNLGSGTKEFRETLQSHIHENLFLLLDDKGVRVYHIDIKQDEGVDFVGDVTDLVFLERLKELGPTAIICSNILEHLKEREQFCKAVDELLPVGGYYFVSCPKDFPYHPDPIDTMFRPNVNELADEFPSTHLIEGEIVACGTWKEKTRYNCRLNYLRCYFKKARQIIRLLMPFYKPSEWLEKVSRQDWIDPNQELSATCIVLQK